MVNCMPQAHVTILIPPDFFFLIVLLDGDGVGCRRGEGEGNWGRMPYDYAKFMIVF